MMKIKLHPVVLSLSFFLLSLQSALSQADSIKPKYGPEATPLSSSHEYFQENSQSQFWSWIPYYVPQRDGRSCSLASITMLINSSRSQWKLTQKDMLVTQDELFKKVNSPIWNQGLGSLGRGVQLDQLGELVKLSLKAYGIAFRSVEVLHVADTSESSEERIHEALLEVEKSKKVLILANFLMSVYLDDAEVGHISPVGAYDSKRKKVLILESDRKWYEPYWVSEKAFLKGMATQDTDAQKNRGLVLVKLAD
jgi:Phytochelatin synthase